MGELGALSAAERDSTADGTAVAVVQIDGPIAQRGEVHLCGYIDGYDWIAGRFMKAITDPKVGAVVLRIDSPGGDLSGLEEAVKRMRVAADREGKHVVAFVDEMAASAAYWIASGVADEIMLPPSGEVGSIGVIGAWVDASEAYKAEGFDVHIVREPAGKAAGHPAGPVAEIADERLAQGVKDGEARFVAAVVARRDKLEASEVRALNGDMLTGKVAVKRGLADKVGSFEDAIDSAARAADRRRREMKNTKALQVLGLDESATDEQIEKAAERFKLGAHALELTGAGDSATARGKLAAWKESAEQVPALKKKLEAVEADKSKGEISSFLLSQIGKKLTPAAAWAKDGDGLPIAGQPADRWVRMGIDEARAFVGELPGLGLLDNNEHEETEADGTDSLSEFERRRCEERGIDPAIYAKNKARYLSSGAHRKGASR